MAKTTMRIRFLPLAVGVFLLAMNDILAQEASNTTTEEVDLDGGDLAEIPPNHDFHKEQGITNPCESHDIYLVQYGKIVAEAKPIATRQNIEDFYNYNRFKKSFDGSDALKRYWKGDRSLAAIHQSKLTCEMSLVLLNSKPWAGPVNNGLKVWVTGDLWNPVVQDDPSFVSFMLFDDKYDSIYLRKGGMTGFEWYWGIQDTDGVAHPIVSPDWKGCTEVSAEFGVPDPYLQFGTPSEWKFVSGGDGDETSLIDLQTQRENSTLFICIDSKPKKTNYEDLHQLAIASDPFPEFCDEEIRYGICGYCTRPVCHWHWFCNIYKWFNCYLGHDVDPYNLPISFGF